MDERKKKNLQESKQQDAGLNRRAGSSLTSSWDYQEHLMDDVYKEYNACRV